MPRRLSFTRLGVLQHPLLFVAISFICGMLLAAEQQISVRHWVIFFAIAWLAASTVLWMNRSNLLVALVSMFACFAAGGALWALSEAGICENSVRRLFERGLLKMDEPIEVWGFLIAAPELAPDRIYLSVAVERVSTLGRQLSASGVVQIVVPFSDYESRLEYDSLALDYGMRLRLLGNLSNRRSYRNPGAPDFDRLLEHRGYDATGWVKSPLLIERAGEAKHYRILSQLYRIRARALAIILRHFTQPASGILAAALFGNRYFLARDAAETFRAGGTFHLLVISGLHVAMLAFVALWLAKYLSNSRFIQFTLVLALMWAYALMVGAQPAITRSVVMLSIVLIGQLIFRTSAGANTLATAAIVLLAWQPRDLFNPGFQLSFLTVLMIVVFTGPIYTRLKKVGEWQPSALTPYPPRVTNLVKQFAEMLFWDETKFREEMNAARIRYRLEKARAARWLNEMRLQKALAWIVVTIFTTTGVQVGLLPLMVMQFHRVSIISPVTNVIEGALIFVLMIAGTVYLVIHSIIGGIALKLAGAVNALGVLTVGSCKPLLVWRGASLRVPDFGESSTLIFVLYFLAVLVLIILINEWNPLRKGDDPSAGRRRVAGRALTIISSLTIIILSLLLILHPFKHHYDRGRLSITFLDVGQGDAMLVTFPEGSLMMLDAGGRPGFGARNESEEGEEVFVEDRIGIAEAAVMPYLWRRGIKRLDWIVASHGDADHVEGFAELVRSFETAHVLRGPSSRPDAFSHIFDQTKPTLQIIKRGDAFEIDGARVEAISPFAEANEPPLSNNNGSLVLKIRYGARSFILTGDIEKEAEARLVAAGGDLCADVLKVAHHGSKTSSTFEFLDKVRPRHAVISAASPSPYGHPHRDVLSRLRGAGARIWQTGACGAITISTDGRDLRVETFVKCE
ncbi:MAG: ComEC/Rec2 family competence protein [Acidobacteria bacterium]|nr:ComEC/Rec2 family competence protein [Acidobacteriota bacterium]